VQAALALKLDGQVVGLNEGHLGHGEIVPREDDCPESVKSCERVRRGGGARRANGRG
jgi:hypothetical protein